MTTFQTVSKESGVKPMEGKLHSVTCDPNCGFMIKSHDEQEVMDVTKMHAKSKHNDDLSDEQVKGMMKSE